MSNLAYHRSKTPSGGGVTVRTGDNQVRLSAGSSQRMRCNPTEAYALLITLAAALGAKVTGLPEWAANTEIEVSDR